MKKLNKITQPLKKLIFIFLVRARCYFILVPFFSRNILVRDTSGNLVPWRQYQGNYKLTILALNADKFMGDPSYLAECENFRILELSAKWLYRLTYCFYPRGTRSIDYFTCSENSKTEKAKEKYRNFLNCFLNKLYQK